MGGTPLYRGMASSTACYDTACGGGGWRIFSWSWSLWRGGNARRKDQIKGTRGSPGLDTCVEDPLNTCGRTTQHVEELTRYGWKQVETRQLT